MRTANGGNGTTPLVGVCRRQFLFREFERFLPRGLVELARGILDKRFCQAVRCVRVAHSETAFDAEVALVEALLQFGGHPNDLVPITVEHQAASIAAIRTGGDGFFGLPLPCSLRGPLPNDGTYRACAHALTAGYAAHILQGQPVGSINLALITTVEVSPAADGHHLSADADTAAAQDATRAEVSDIGVRTWVAGQRAPPAPRHHVYQVLICVVLQEAVPGGFAYRQSKG